MRALLTADWQTEWSNIPQCRLALKQVIKLVKKNKIEIVIFIGDLKSRYNPVDIRVIQFWQRAIAKLKKLGLLVIVALGNHDRLGMYEDKENWLSILKMAGADVYDEPEVIDLVRYGKIGILPFTTSVKLLRKRANDLAKNKWNNKTDILVFHNDISECRYNKLGEQSHSKFSFRELNPDKYLACIGGHIHLPQELGDNGYYVGNPFCEDWGEANQQKRYLLVLDEEIKSIDSEIPGWYDKSWPDYHKPKSWEGCRLRIHVDIKGKDYERKMDRVRKNAEHKYRGASIFIKPNFEGLVEGEFERKNIQLHGDDEEKISYYVGDTLPKNLRESSHKIVALLASKLKEAERSRRPSGEIEFIDAEGENVLSFKKLYCDFRQKGIVAVEGRNEDWHNQSNGCGKTSYVNLIPIAIEGTTFKGQKTDRWARRHTDKSAWLQLRIKDEHNRKIKIIRGRRPTKLQLFIDGIDNSSGMNRNKNIGTQEHIQSVTGFNWKTLANSVYIDRKVTDEFLNGTEKERTELMYSFLNLERFKKALELLKEHRRNHNLAVSQVESNIDVLKGKIDEADENLNREKYRRRKNVESVKKEYRARLKGWKVLHTQKLEQRKRCKRKLRKLEPKYKATMKQAEKWHGKVRKLDAVLELASTTLQKHERIARQGSCPTCGADVDKDHWKTRIKEVKHEIKSAESKREKYNIERKRLEYRGKEIESEIDQLKIDAGEAKSKADIEYLKLRHIKDEIARLEKREASRVHELTDKLDMLKEMKRDNRKYLHSIREDEHIIDYCEHAFGRDGIPAWLIYQLTPTLTEASEHYSDVFVDRTFVVRFEDNGKGIEPKIVYPTGGDRVTDLSVGESAMASIITSFALKEVSPKTNILIIDEPGDGMSDYNLRRLADGLKKLNDRFRTIFVISHQQELLGALQTNKVITIIKKDGISRVHET